jgi:LPXTG-motif cell wall-anchored protein
VLGTGDDVRIIVTSNQSGVYRLNNAPVGRYRVVGAFTPPDGLPLPPRQEASLAREQTIQIDIPIGALQLGKPKILPKGSFIGGSQSASAVLDANGKVLVLPGTGTSGRSPMSMILAALLLLAGGWLVLRRRRNTTPDSC